MGRILGLTMRLQGRQPGVLIVHDRKPHRRSRVGNRKMIKARHRYERRIVRQQTSRGWGLMNDHDE